MKKLKCLPIVIDYTNSLLERYNRMISREEARAKSMTSVLQEFPDLKAKHPQFKEAMVDFGTQKV
jgi:hypothetical protein